MTRDFFPRPLSYEKVSLGQTAFEIKRAEFKTAESRQCGFIKYKANVLHLISISHHISKSTQGSAE